jgi:hypothetical protein
LLLPSSPFPPTAPTRTHLQAEYKKSEAKALEAFKRAKERERLRAERAAGAAAGGTKKGRDDRAARPELTEEQKQAAREERARRKREEVCVCVCGGGGGCVCGGVHAWLGELVREGTAISLLQVSDILSMLG